MGLTFPKRARGLVKNGRAEYVGDCEIRLLFQSFGYGTDFTHDPSVNKNTEDKIMSKVINFNAREFKFDKTCENNVGSRMFVTDCTGRSAEIYEIGDWNWSWTQICCEKLLEKETDYVFRFSMTGGINDTCDATSQFVIVPIENEEFTSEDWENRYAYNLAQSQYKPAMSKRWGNGMLRVYEIPFNTGSCGKFRFVFIAMHAVAGFYPANELADYAELEDYCYGDWYKERFGRKNQSVNVIGADRGSFGCCSDGEIKIDNENMDGSDFAETLRSVGDGGSVCISNCNISDIEMSFDCGGIADGCCFEMSNTKIGGDAFYGILGKIGDGCNINFSNIVVSSAEEPYPGTLKRVDGCVWELSNVMISGGAFCALLSKLGDGCILELNSTKIAGDGTDSDFGRMGDGVVINFSKTEIPESIYRRIKENHGDGCCISEEGLKLY